MSLKNFYHRVDLDTSGEHYVEIIAFPKRDLIQLQYLHYSKDSEAGIMQTTITYNYGKRD